MAEKTTLLYRAGQGVATMVSFRQPMTLKSTEYPVLDNVRYRTDCLEIRKPDAAFTNSGLPGSAVFYTGGSWSGLIAGVEYALVAVKNGTSVDIYDSTNCAAWVNQSSSTAKAYGITQLTDATAATNGITFQPINDPVLGEAVVISDGTTSLLWQPTAINSERLRKIVAITTFTGGAPSALIIQNAAYSTTPFTFTNVGSTPGVTFTAASGTNGTIGVQTPQNPAGADFIVMNFSLTLGVSAASSQVALFATVPSATYGDFFRACKMELFSSGVYTTIYDPSASGTGGSPPFTETYSATDVAGLPSPCQFVTWSIPNTFTASVTKMKLTYKGPATQFTAGTIQIYAMMMNSGAEPPAGFQDYAIAYRSQGTGVESAGKVLDSSVAVGGNLWQYYGTTAAPNQTTTLPISSFFRGQWTVVDSAPPAVASDGSFNQFCLYRKDSGGTDYFFVTSTNYTTWTAGAPGAWSLTSSTYAALAFDNKDINSLDYERPLPSVYNTSCGGFTCAIGLNDRLFTGTVNQYKFSEFKWPMRFGLAVDVNAIDRSSGSYRFKSETPKAFYAVVDNNQFDRTNDKAAIVTDKRTLVISGQDTFSLIRPAKLIDFGTASPKSFTTRRDTTFFLDDARRIHSAPFSQGLDSKSTDIKDILDGIPAAYIAKVAAANFDDRIYLFYTPSGQTINNAAAVLDLITGSLTRDTYTLGITSAIVNGSRLLAFMSDGSMRQLESLTPAVVSNVSVVSREIGTSGESWMGGAHRIYCDGVAATNLTLSWTPYKVGTAGIITDTLSIAPDSGEDRTDRWSNLGKGVRGRSIKFGLSGNVLSGTKFYAWQIESKERIEEGDR